MAQAFSRVNAFVQMAQAALLGITSSIEQQAIIKSLPDYQSRGHAQKHKHPMRNASNKYARTFNGEREMARRQRQMGVA